MNKKQLIIAWVMNPLLLPILILFLLSGCATRSRCLTDGREYMEYDVLLDQDKGEFYVPLRWIKEQEESKNKPN